MFHGGPDVSLLHFALKNLAGHAFRSLVVGLCVFLVAAFSLFSTLVIRGSEHSLQLGIERLGADLVVVPKGVEGKVEHALLMGKPANVWMPDSTLEQVRGTPGVAAVSPQLFLASLRDASCCAVSEMFIIAFDPLTDFTVRPWLERTPAQRLALGEAIGGAYVFLPEGDDHIKLYGYFLTLKGNLEPTGTGLDQTMFFTFETAQEVAQVSLTKAEKPLVIPSGQISAILVKVEPGADSHAVAQRVMQTTPGVSAVESPHLFKTFRKQMTGLVQGFVAALGLVWLLAVVLIALVFTMVVNERRRELGVLRALGSTGGFVLRSLLLEAALLALAGGLAATALATLAVVLFRDLLIASLGIPFLFPTLPEYVALVVAGLTLSLGSVTAATLWPALRVCRRDPALAMRV